MRRIQPPQQQQCSGNIAFRALLWTLTLLPLCLATFTFGLQWRGGALSGPNPIGRFLGSNFRLPRGSLTSPSVAGRTRPDANTNCWSEKRKTPSVPHHPGWQYAIVGEARPKIGICSSTSATLDQILPWLYYHRVLGVTNFFLFVEGIAASAFSSAVLHAIPGVEVVHRTKELEDQQARSRIWNETWLASFFHRPCNYELFVRQSLNMEMAIVMARTTVDLCIRVKKTWRTYLNSLTAGTKVWPFLRGRYTPEYSLHRLLTDVAADVDMVIFPNYESAIERDDIKDPFTEVSMFKKNYDHVMKETYFAYYREATRGNPNYFITYGNGKAAARIQKYLRPNGAHRWQNYGKTPNEIKLEEAAVLHFTYSKFSDLTSRRDRCGCKPTKEDVKKCFMLDFDRDAFIIASTFTEEEMRIWYRKRIVWTDQEMKLKLIRRGLLTRIFAPQVIIQGLREAGVYSDALIAGQILLQKYKSRDDFLSSVTKSNSSVPSAPRETYNMVGDRQSNVAKSQENRQKDLRRLGTDETANARRQSLQFCNVQPKAIPPLPSPTLSSSQV